MRHNYTRSVSLYRTKSAPYVCVSGAGASFSDDQGTSSPGQRQCDLSKQDGDSPKHNDVGDDLRVTKATWAAAEDDELMATVWDIGTVWPCVAARLPGRTADAVRNRWHRLRHQRSIVSSPSCREIASPSFPSAEMAPPPPSRMVSRDDSSEATLSVASHIPAVHQTLNNASSPILRIALPASETQPSPQLGVIETAGAVESGRMPATGVHARACWTAHEDEMIIEGVRKFGCKWRQIAASLPRRSDSSVRNRWVRLQTMAQRRSGSDWSSTCAEGFCIEGPSCEGLASDGDESKERFAGAGELAMAGRQSGGDGGQALTDDTMSAQILVSFATQKLT